MLPPLLETKNSTLKYLLSRVAACVSGVELYFLVKSLNQYDLSFFQSTFTHATSTLVGVISFIPGGIGATEFTISKMLAGFGLDLNYSVILSFIIRLITIWYATILGFIMLFIRFFRKNT